MRFIVYGAGAIGGLVGALLSEHHDVVLIARGAHAEVIRRDGLTVEDVRGRRVFRLPVAATPAEVAAGPGDVVLLGMKSQDTPAALDALRRVAPQSTPVVCLQNGVDNERACLRLFSGVYGVCVICPAEHLEPGVVHAFSSPTPGLLDIGRFPDGTDELSAAIAGAFRDAGFESEERPDIMRWKYRKLIMNLGNAAEAVLERPSRSEIVDLARHEGVACLEAAGIDVASSGEEHSRRGDALQMHEVAGRPHRGGSSWQSLQRGAGSIESDYLNGEIVLLGRLHGVPTPVNSLLQALAWDAVRQGSTPGQLSAAQFRDLLDSA